MKQKPIKSFYRSNAPQGYPTYGKRYKPLRYFIAGGADIDGETKEASDPALSDPDKDEETVMAQAFGLTDRGDLRVAVDVMCDPRQDVFSIVSMASDSPTRRALESLSKKQSVPDVESPEDSTLSPDQK